MIAVGEGLVAEISPELGFVVVCLACNDVAIYDALVVLKINKANLLLGVTVPFPELM